MRKSWIVLAGIAGAAGSLSAPLPLVAGAQPPDWVGGRAAVARLGRRLPAVAARNALSALELRRNLLTDRSLLVDVDDQLLYIEPSEEASDSSEIESAPAAVDPSAALTLHSRPGSPRVIYLDFDGHIIDGTAWNAKTGGPCYADAYDSDGAPGTFSPAELTAISGVWARVAEDYAPFDVDVTTVDPGPDAITRSSATDTQYGTRVLVSRSMTVCPNGKSLYSSVCSGGCGGIAYVGVFDRTSSHAYYQPAFVFQNGVGPGQKNIAEASSHEAGHSLGLSHDGTATSGYYGGHGSWAPIMGVGYTKPVTQWSKGEYAGATQTQDDFVVIQSNGALPVPDDHPDSSSTPLDPSAPTTGIISTRIDVDTFSITVAQRTDITVAAAAAETSPDLDIYLTLDGPGIVLFDDPASGTVTSDIATGLNASISATIDAGSYTVVVDGVGAGDPLNTGYSDYGSIGTYTVSLTATPVEPPPPAPPPPSPAITLSVQAYRLNARNRADLTWDDPSGSYQVYRNGQILPAIVTSGRYTDVVSRRVTTATYRVCTFDAPSICSNDVTVTW
jgi:hypothetical protein